MNNQSINENEANINHARFETRSVTDIIDDQTCCGYVEECFKCLFCFYTGCCCLSICIHFKENVCCKKK